MKSSFFAIELSDAMTKEGCPICNAIQNSTRRYMRFYLYENVNDSFTRNSLAKSLGFCREHIQLFAKTEQERFKTISAFNIVYEHMNREAVDRIQNWRHYYTPPSLKEKIIEKLCEILKIPLCVTTLQPAKLLQGECIVCRNIKGNLVSYIKELVDFISRQDAEMIGLYQASNGVCLEHLQYVFQHYQETAPQACDFLANDIGNRLSRQQQQMQQYIRKSDWQHRFDVLSDEEVNAWRKTYAFFSGKPAANFRARRVMDPGTENFSKEE